MQTQSSCRLRTILIFAKEDLMNAAVPPHTLSCLQGFHTIYPDAESAQSPLYRTDEVDLIHVHLFRNCLLLFGSKVYKQSSLQENHRLLKSYREKYSLPELLR